MSSGHRTSEFKEGKLVTKYNDEKIMLEAEFKNGVRSGPFTIWYENGQLMLKGQFKEGYPEGKTTTWYENGNVRQEVEVLDGFLHGYSKSWHENAQLMEEGHYLFGNKIGVWRQWDQKGSLLSDSIHDGAETFQKTLSTRSDDFSSFSPKLIDHPYFKPLALFTLLYMLLSSILFYSFESGMNVHIATFWDALKWVTSTIPVFGKVEFKPISTGGLIIASLAHLCGFFAFCFWLALLGWAFFSRQYERALHDIIKGKKNTN